MASSLFRDDATGPARAASEAMRRQGPEAVFGALVRNQCCDAASTLTLSIMAATTPATVTVDNVAVMAERI